jgi:hypothetical protein
LVCCASRGGPFDDASFLAGWAAGRLEAYLARGGPWLALSRVLRADLLPVIDELALRFGRSITAEPVDDPHLRDAWVRVEFVAIEGDDA